MLERIQRLGGKGALWATKLELRESHEALRAELDELRRRVQELERDRPVAR